MCGQQFGRNVGKGELEEDGCGRIIKVSYLSGDLRFTKDKCVFAEVLSVSEVVGNNELPASPFTTSLTHSAYKISPPSISCPPLSDSVKKKSTVVLPNLASAAAS